MALAVRLPPAFVEAKGSMAGLTDKLLMRRDRIEHVALIAILKWASRFSADVPVDQVLKAVKDEKDPKPAVLAILVGVLNQFPDIAQEVKNIAADSQAKATAEGTVFTGAIINHHKGFSVPNLDDAASNELAKLKKADNYYTGTDTTVALILSGLAGDLVAKENAQTSVTKTIDFGAGAVFYLGMVIHQYFTDAQLAHLVNAGEATVDFITSGGNVCPVCLGYESQNPWKTTEVPVPPIHGACRCILAPAGAIT